MITKADIEKYFIAEKQESLLFIVVGIVALALAIVAWQFWKTPGWKGAAIPLVCVGLLQLTVGYTVHARSDEQRINMVYALDMNPAKLVQEELPRMQLVNKKFIVYRWVEILLLLTGIVLAIVYQANDDRQFMRGIGIALAVQAALMLGADFFAERRAIAYTNQLAQLKKP